MTKRRDIENSNESKQSLKSCNSVRNKAKQVTKKVSKTAAKVSHNLNSKRVQPSALKPVIIEIEKEKLIGE